MADDGSARKIGEGASCAAAPALEGNVTVGLEENFYVEDGCMANSNREPTVRTEQRA